MYKVSAKFFSNALMLPVLNATYLCHESWKGYLLLKPYWKAAVKKKSQEIKAISFR